MEEGQSTSPAKPSQADWLAAATIAWLLRDGGAEADANDAYEHMLKTAFHRGGGQCRVGQNHVAEFVQEKLGVLFPADLVDDAVKRLVEKRELVVLSAEEADHLALAQDCYAKIEQDEIKLQELRGTAIDGWFAAETRRDPQLSECRDTIIPLIESYIIGVASFVAMEGLASCEGDSPLPPVPEPSEQTLVSLHPELRDTAREACKRFFTEADDIRLRYIDALLDGYYELQLLRCTPEIQGLFNPQLRETTCFLDTNILLDVLGINDDAELNALSLQAIHIAKSLGVNVCAAEETRQEYLRLLEDARRQRATAYSVLVDDDDDGRNPGKASPFLCHYARSLAANRQLTWAEYEAQYRELATLLNARNLTYEPGMWVSNRDAVEQTAGVFDEAWPSKRHNARLHDAAMYLLVRQLRIDRRSGIRVWLLTRDYSLHQFDTVVRRRLQDPGMHMPSFAIRPHSWIQWLRSRAAAQMTDNDQGNQFGRLLYDLRFARTDRPERDARVVARQTLYLETYRDLDPEVIQSQDTARLIGEELEHLGGAEAASDLQVAEIVDGALLAGAQRANEEGRMKDDQLLLLKEQINQLEERVGEAEELRVQVGEMHAVMQQGDARSAELAQQVADLAQRSAASGEAQTLLLRQLGAQRLALSLLATAMSVGLWLLLPSPYNWLVPALACITFVASRFGGKTGLLAFFRTPVWTPVLWLTLVLVAKAVLRNHLPKAVGGFLDNDFPELAAALVIAAVQVKRGKAPQGG